MSRFEKHLVSEITAAELDAKTKQYNKNVISKEIKNLLAKGKKVRSGAAGRVGDIVGVDKQGAVQIKIRGRKGVTSFDSGDNVEIKKKGDTYIVVNKK